MLKLLMSKKLRNVEELDSLIQETKEQNFFRLELCSNTIAKFIDLFSELDGAEDYVPKKDLKKLRNLIFKLYKKQNRKDNKSFRNYNYLIKLRKKINKVDYSTIEIKDEKEKKNE